MKFIRDIIADKRDQVPPNDGQVTEPRSDQDVMSAILTEAAPIAETFRLDSTYQVPEPGIEEPALQPDPTTYTEPEFSDDLTEEDQTAALIAGLSNLDHHDSDAADIGGLETNAFTAASNTQPEVSFTDEIPHPAQRHATVRQTQDVSQAENSLEDDVQRLTASVTADHDAPEQRPFKRFTRTQTRLRNLEVEEADEPVISPETPPKRAMEETRRPAPPLQHPAPIRQKAEPEAAPAPAPASRLQQSAPQPQPAAPEQVAPVAPAQPIDVPSPAMGRGSSKAGRVKTRLLGFNPGQAAGADPFTTKGDKPGAGYTQYPVGWLAVVKGPGRGAAFTLFSGVTIIGRGEDQTVRLDFGDNSISRANHAAIAFDPEQNSFYIGHGSKANLVRRNNRPVLSTEELGSGDLIRIGETTLRFVPLCGRDFDWNDEQQSEAGHAS